MVSNKSRSYPSLDAESEVKEAYGNQTLPVAVLPKDFDGIPLDGSQYLATVRASADLLPSYFYASNPYATQSSNDVTMEGTEKLPNEEDGAEEEGIPSNEWRETFVERFSNMREAIRNTPTLPFNANSPASKANLPSAGDKNAWYHFIYRAKVSSLIDTTLTPLPIANPVPQPEVSVSVSEYIPEEQKEMEQSDSSLDQEMAQPETDAASKVQTNLQTPNLGSRQNEACPQMLEEEMELYQEQLSEQKNPLKRKAIEDGGVEGEIGEVSDVELTLKEEKKRQKNANRNEPRSLRFPSPSLMRRFDLQTSLELIGYITEWIQTPNPTTTDTIAQSTSTSTSTTNPTDPSSTSSPTAISDFLSLWTFSLLSELDRNLLSDEISVLRELVRSVIEALKLWRMRKKLLDSMSKSKEKEKIKGNSTSEDENESVKEDPETGAWMIVAIVVGIWGQMDLWEDAKSALRKV